MITIVPPVPIHSTADAVTFALGDWAAFLDRIEDLEDLTSVRAYDAWAMSIGPDEAKRLSYSIAEVERMIDGASPVTIWREKAGLTQRALAKSAEVSVTNLSEIEAGKKPGSAETLRKLAEALRVPMEVLVG